MEDDNVGGRGSASGISDKGKKYGTEFSTLLKVSNIKFVKYNSTSSAKEPMETRTKGRVYVLVNSQNKLKSIIYFDEKTGKRRKVIGLDKPHNGKLPHTHHGYRHEEDGTTNLSTKEKEMVDFVYKVWYNKNGK